MPHTPESSQREQVIHDLPNNFTQHASGKVLGLERKIEKIGAKLEITRQTSPLSKRRIEGAENRIRRYQNALKNVMIAEKRKIKKRHRH